MPHTTKPQHPVEPDNHKHLALQGFCHDLTLLESITQLLADAYQEEGNASASATLGEVKEHLERARSLITLLSSQEAEGAQG